MAVPGPGRAKLSEGIGVFFGIATVVLIFLMVLPWLETYRSHELSGFGVISREVAVEDEVTPVFWIVIWLIPFLFFIIRGASNSVQVKDRFDNGGGAAMMLILGATYITLFFNTVGNDDDILVGAVLAFFLAVALSLTALKKLSSAENADSQIAWLFFIPWMLSGNEDTMFIELIFEKDDNQPYILVLIVVAIALIFMAVKGRSDKALHRGIQMGLAVPAGVFIYRFTDEFLFAGQRHWDEFGISHVLLLLLSMLVFMRIVRTLGQEAAQAGRSGELLS